jgi:hypothetical protein
MNAAHLIFFFFPSAITPVVSAPSIIGGSLSLQQDGSLLMTTIQPQNPQALYPGTAGVVIMGVDGDVFNVQGQTPFNVNGINL